MINGTNRILIFIILSLGICVGCQGNKVVDAKLTQAKQYMHSRPDSALQIIATIKPEDISRRSTRAKYALLYSQALDKNEIDLVQFIVAITEQRKHIGWYITPVVFLTYAENNGFGFFC